MVKDVKNTKNNSRPQMLKWAVLPIVILVITGLFIVYSSKPSNDTQITENTTYQGETISYKGIPDVMLKGNGVLTLWFDDAWESQFEEAFPYLVKNNISAALAVPTELVGYDAYMTWDQVRLLAKSGWEITSHSKTHPCNIHELDFNRLNNEIGGSKNDLFDQGIETEIYLPPCGIRSEKSDSLVSYHYKYQRLSVDGYNKIPVSKPYQLKIKQVSQKTTHEDVTGWIETAQEQNSWLILMFHQVDSGGMEYSIDPKTFTLIINEVINSNIQVVLPTQILKNSI